MLWYHGVVERNRISSLQSHGKALEKECCLAGIFCDSGDTPANLLCELNGHLMPCTSCFYGKWVEVCTGQFGVFVYLVLRCLLGCCTWFSCCFANVRLSICVWYCSKNVNSEGVSEANCYARLSHSNTVLKLMSGEISII